MSFKITDSTPSADGFHMPAEFEPQERIYMIWPERPDNWRNGARQAQETYARIAEAISEFTPVTMLVSDRQYEHARMTLPGRIRVVEASSNDAWCRDMGPTMVINEDGAVRGVDWRFNAWGGLYDGLYFPWDQDDRIASKICELEGKDYYRLADFVLEGGSIHVDGEGTVLTTKMCLLSSGRNPGLTIELIEEKLNAYLGTKKVLWLDDGIDPDETNGHIDDVACFVAPGEVACIYTDDPKDPFYEASQKAYMQLSGMTDAKGRQLKVHKICTPQNSVTLPEDYEVNKVSGSVPRNPGDLCIASYLNFLITNGGVIVPQYGDTHDRLALDQLSAIFPGRKVVGVYSREVVYGGGNIHCITQQIPAANTFAL